MVCWYLSTPRPLSSSLYPIHHPSTGPYSHKKPPLLSCTFAFTLISGAINFNIDAVCWHSLLPCSSPSLRHFFICSSDLIWIKHPGNFHYSINRSGHVQALTPSAYSSSCPSPPFSWSCLSAGNYMLLIHQLRISVHRFSAPLEAVTSYD